MTNTCRGICGFRLLEYPSKVVIQLSSRPLRVCILCWFAGGCSRMAALPFSASPLLPRLQKSAIVANLGVLLVITSVTGYLQKLLERTKVHPPTPSKPKRGHHPQNPCLCGWGRRWEKARAIQTAGLRRGWKGAVCNSHDEHGQQRPSESN